MGEGEKLIPLPQEFKDVQFSNETKEKACVAVFASIKRAMELTEAGVKVNGQPMIVGLTDWHKFLEATGGHEIAWDPQLGMVQENEVFKTTRDGWSQSGTHHLGSVTRHGRPSVKGVAKDNTRYISIIGNSAGREFDDQALPSGAAEVRIFESGDIKVLDKLGEKEREPEQAEVEEVCEIFSEIYSKLKGIIPEDKSTKKLPSSKPTEQNT